MALPSEFPLGMPSSQDGSGHGWIQQSNSSEFLQQKSLLSEIQTELTSAIACAVIQREASANKSYWSDILSKMYLESTQKMASTLPELAPGNFKEVQ